MADCRIVNAKVLSALEDIGKISESYTSDGEDFLTALGKAIAEMEGSTKDALENFFNTEVKTYVITTIPQALSGMPQLLEANRSHFETVDPQIAKSITG